MPGSQGGDSNAEILSDGDDDQPKQATEAEVREYAEFLGIDPKKEPSLMWIAREGVAAPVPHPWKACKEDGEVFYFNFETSESLWDHPCDAHYRSLVEKHRRSAGREKDDDSSEPPSSEAASKDAVSRKVGATADDDDSGSFVSDAVDESRSERSGPSESFVSDAVDDKSESSTSGLLERRSPGAGACDSSTLSKEVDREGAGDKSATFISDAVEYGEGEADASSDSCEEQECTKPSKDGHEPALVQDQQRRDSGSSVDEQARAETLSMAIKCRNCGNTGVDIMGRPCTCAYAKKAGRPQPVLDNGVCSSAHSARSSCPSEVSEDFRSDWGAPSPPLRSPCSGSATGADGTGHSLEVSQSMSIDADAGRLLLNASPVSPPAVATSVSASRARGGAAATASLSTLGTGSASKTGGKAPTWCELRRELDMLASAVTGCKEIYAQQREYMRRLKSGA